MPICDGCRVNSLWEHRCHKENAYVRGEATGRPCDCSECRWESFFFGSDRCIVLVDSRFVWATKVIALYEKRGGISYLLTAKRNSIISGKIPSFGFLCEHTGPYTLKDWADQKGINLNDY